MKHTPQNCRQESIMQLLRVYFWDVYTVYINDPQAEKSLKFTRKDEYVYQFVRLIIEDHSPDKDVAYFEPFYLKEFVASQPKKLL